MDCINLKGEKISGALSRNKFLRLEGLNNFVVYYTNDFSTISREVDVRTRRVRLLSLEGAGKTTLLKAILNQTRQSTASGVENLLSEVDAEEDVAGGLCYMDSTGKDRLIVLVHDLAHKIPQCSNSNASQQRPTLSLLLDEAKALGVPWVLATTNKFSVSAHQQKARIDAVLQAYQASPSNTEILNSYSYVVHTARKGRMVVNSLCQLVHRVPRSYEESSFQEFAKDRLLLEMTRGHAAKANAIRQAPEKANSLSTTAVGASLGAGLGIVLAIILGAASALRKP
ncbi:hypothetical protein Ancab_022206 [Ancistrocladus abbreviatus]